MSLNLNTNYLQNPSSSISSKNKNSQNENNFYEILNKNIEQTEQEKISTIIGEMTGDKPKISIPEYEFDVGKKDFNNIVEKLLARAEKLAKEKNDPKLNELKRIFYTQIDFYNLILSNLDSLSNDLNTNLKNNKGALIATELANSMATHSMAMGGILDVALNFFSTAGLDNEIMKDLSKLQKYIDTHKHIAELDNGKVVSHGDSAKKQVDRVEDEMLKRVLSIVN